MEYQKGMNVNTDLSNTNAAANIELESLLDLLGAVGGYSDDETFQKEKEDIINSGIPVEAFLEILGENMVKETGARKIVDLPVQLLNDKAILPRYAHETDACADLYAAENCVIEPGETKLISTGLAFAIPEGYVMHIYPRSSTGIKTPLRLPNSVGVIDSGYRDEVKLIFQNTGNEPFEIYCGDRLAQMSIDVAPAALFKLVPDVKSIGEDRGGGFGSTGTNQMNGEN